MNRTPIEWVKNPDGTPGYTWNPITGCLNGCPYCYARKLANGRLRQRYLANKNLSPDYLELKKAFDRNKLEPFQDPFYPRFWEGRLEQPIEHPTPQNPKKRKGIFTCDMSDLFGIGVPAGWTEQVMTTIKLCPYHRFYLLTKQPQNLIKFSPFPPNCWVGITYTCSGKDNKFGYPFMDIKASAKFISFEPLLGRDPLAQDWDKAFVKAGVNWLIIGASTSTIDELDDLSQKYPGLKIMRYGKKYTLQPKIEWVEEIVRAADGVGIPVFLKDNLRPMFGVMTSKEAIEYGNLNKPHLIEEISFNGKNEIIAHKLRQEMPA